MSQTAITWPTLPPENASAIELMEWGILEFGERLGIRASFGAGPLDRDTRFLANPAVFGRLRGRFERRRAKFGITG